jgi:hypothetical protein
MDESALRLRYLRDPVPQRLGNLASTLSRLSDFIIRQRSADSVLAVVCEGQCFIDWTRHDVEAGTAAELDQLALELKGWRDGWAALVTDPARISEVSRSARTWADRVLELSGLLSTPR